MPIYEYKCDAGHEFEVEQGILDVPLATCHVRHARPGQRYGTRCGSPCHRLISKGTGFTLKGRGWAKDGYS